MDYIKTFVSRIYRRQILNWTINKALFVISLLFTVYIFWLFFNKIFYMTPLERKIFPLTLILSFIPFLFGRPSFSGTLDFIEQEIKELKGRLFLIMEPYPSPLDSKVYSKRAIKESSKILQEKDPKDLTPLKMEYKYLKYIGLFASIFIILSIFSVDIRLKKVTTMPVLTYVKDRIQENKSFLIMAKSNELKNLYLFSDEGIKKMINLGGGKFGIMTTMKSSSEIQVGYRVWKSGKETIDVVPSLFIDELELTYEFPDYLETEIFYDTLYNIKEYILIHTLEGTKVNFSGISNKVLGDIKGEISNENLDDKSFSGSFEVRNKKKLSVKLTDSAFFSSCTISFFIDPIKDELPEIEFIYPRRDYELNESMEVPIIIQAEDDYSISSTAIVYGKEKIYMPVSKNTKFFEDSITLQVGDLMPGETLKVTSEATDFAGNKAFSSPIFIYMPTLEQIFGEYRAREDTLEKYTDAFKETEIEIAEKIEKFLYGGKFGRESQEKIRRTLKQQKDLIEGMQKLAEITERIRSPEISEELDRIKELLSSSHVKEFLNDLNKMMKDTDISPEELKKFSDSQKDLLETLELFKKSLEYLKKLLELNEFSNIAREIYEKQKEINSLEPNEKLSKIQKELTQELESLIDDMQKSLEDKVKQIASEFKQTNTVEEMQRLADLMQKGKSDQERSERIEENLRKLNMALNASREYSAGEKIREAIKIKGWELNFILRTHNNLIDKKVGLEKGLIEQGLLEALTRIEYELQILFLETLAFSPDVFSSLSRAKEKMKNLSIELTQKEVPRESMERVNDLIIQAILKLFSSPPPSSESLSSAINQIIQQQNSIMQGLGKILPLEVPSPSMSGELRSLMEKQRQLAEELRRMGKAFEPLSSEMDDMADDLARGKLDQKLIERQKKVLDRLLEAEKAVREGKISRRRRSEPGIFVSPKKVTIPKNFGEEKKYLRDLLDKRIQEPYPEEYKKEIEEYFRRLIE